MNAKQITRYLQHKVLSEKDWNMRGAINDYLYVAADSDAYALLAALDRFENGSDMTAVAGAFEIARMVQKMLVDAYGEEAAEHQREVDKQELAMLGPIHERGLKWAAGR